jgi:hypothetical protein
MTAVEQANISAISLPRPIELTRRDSTEPVLRLPTDFTPKPLASPALTAAQKTKLAELRAKIPGLLAKPPVHEEDAAWLTDDKCLLRYLRATSWHVAKATDRIAGTLKWRHERRPHRIDPDYVRPESETGKLTLNGFDRYGRPVLYLIPARENTKTSPRQVDNFIFFMERAITVMPPGIDQLIMVIDFTGTSMFQSPGVGVAREIATTLEQHYPERLGAAFIIGAPWFFSQAYKIISPFLNEVTQKKIQFINIKLPPRPTLSSSTSLPVTTNNSTNTTKINNRKSWLSLGRQSGEITVNSHKKYATIGPSTSKGASNSNNNNHDDDDTLAPLPELDKQSNSSSVISTNLPQGVPSPIWDIISPELLDVMVGGQLVFRHEMPTYWDHLLLHTVDYIPEKPSNT